MPLEVIFMLVHMRMLASLQKLYAAIFKLSAILDFSKASIS